VSWYEFLFLRVIFSGKDHVNPSLLSTLSSLLSPLHSSVKEHSWTCPGCETFNTGLTYPKCYVCDNTSGPDGENLVTKMKNDVTKVLLRLNNPKLFSENTDDDSDNEEDDSLDDSDDDTASKQGFAGGERASNEKSLH